MCKSESEKAATTLQGDLRGYTSDIKGLNVNVNNPFANYKTPFGYSDISSELKKLYGISLNEVDTTANDAIKGVQQDTAARMASQGITGGSLLNSQVNAGANGINKNRLASKTSLLKNQASNNLSAMDMENRNKFQNTSAKGNFDLANIQNLFQKYGLLGGAYGQQQSNLSNLDSTTWLDDLLAVANTGANLFSAINGGSDNAAKMMVGGG